MAKVHFVGAGPGDPKLITLQGYQLLQEAGVVIYAGSLVNPELLNYCGTDCQIFNSASMDLWEIIDEMEKGVKAGKEVVRLQTGDFSIYGSIREQVEELRKRQIEFTCTPGVSSFLGAASSLGVEYTVPEVSQSVVITRMAGRTPVPAKESIRSFAQHQTSMVIFLSVQSIKEVVRELLAGGYQPTTPIAVVYKATWPEEKKIISTLANIVDEIKATDITKTALIMVGDFLGDEFHYSKLYDATFPHEYRDAKIEE
ncbi:precorrin-4/cobalt-precorrin-4 C11-methyltransferase [Enterococcus sp. PF1-24]|uniref:cobalt-precorrin-4 methyltransferase n=1 Tax=unclassified Enterococcus TaxID=2608891 RepID=UPI002473DB00|nr:MULTISPECIES: cobalt-precorrin-4 methyltransferase [unclassified Enterococcus]MDH6363383.1 precorrin-4/cobalt-precorrin-4 C11-methyltransferase [Enterococcus sp. PFB1-1]MDH6400316.1 precorrin-4/cobalt-precorrin-4 C11-methyltransferase [Enterococcus sp. PF1-24]